jgi:DeoR family transcriptional regulator of aga operon
MLGEERRTQILHLLREQGRVQVKDLSHRFRTSEVTIRNDLKELHLRGLVRRAHGGAVKLDETIIESPLQERVHAHADEKRRIGAAAAALIKDGEHILLDSGTTTHEIAKRIKHKQNLQVITNGVNIAMELVGAQGIQLILLGGVLKRDSFSVVGHFPEVMLGELSADKFFIGAAGCDVNFGLSNSDIEEARVNQAMLKIAREKILVADSSKFGRRSLVRIVSLLEMNKVITDNGLPDAMRHELDRLGVETILV